MRSWVRFLSAASVLGDPGVGASPKAVSHSLLLDPVMSISGWVLLLCGMLSVSSLTSGNICSK